MQGHDSAQVLNKVASYNCEHCTSRRRTQQRAQHLSLTHALLAQPGAGKDHGADEGETGALNRQHARAEGTKSGNLQHGRHAGYDQRAADDVSGRGTIHTQPEGNQQRRCGDAGHNSEQMRGAHQHRFPQWRTLVETIQQGWPILILRGSYVGLLFRLQEKNTGFKYGAGQVPWEVQDTDR